MKRGLCLLVVIAAMALCSEKPLRADPYLRPSDAPHAIFSESTGAEQRELVLTGAEAKVLGEWLGRRVDLVPYAYLEVRKDKEILGEIFVLDVIGQSRPITFAVGVGVDGRLRDIQVMVYREPQGEQIQEARFRRQFAGKKAEDPIAIGKDIDVISGASISSRSATYAAKKALLLAAIVQARLRAANTP